MDRSLLANAIRALAMDAVEAANSGHPGAPLGMADFAEVLWNDFLTHNPANPAWPDRDRFVLSNGHGSMLLYALLHLTGYELSIEDIKAFRTLGSKTPGHPEYGHTPGVETTTGPLGQGVANAVGMALAERLMAARYNTAEHEIVDHRTYVVLGDGCLMEGVAQEAASLAGTLKLGKLTALYDDNGISIDGSVADWFADDTPKKFEAMGWKVIPNVNGHDAEAVKKALKEATGQSERPTLICLKTTIGQGAPTKCGSAGCHGSPLGQDEIAAARAAMGWNHGPFEIPAEVYNAYDAKATGQAAEDAWRERFEAYAAAYPEKAAEFLRTMSGELPETFEETAEALIEQMAATTDPNATRKSSKAVLDGLAPGLPELLGGSADLTGSNGTLHVKASSVRPGDYAGNYIHYGVREFAMGAVMNGMALHGGVIPYSGTFLVFADYARNSIRMAALMGIRVIHVLTHDSIGVGEDGPTHQPVEHVASLRLIPGCQVLRPCDNAETAVAWKQALEYDGGPSCLVLTRQKLTQHPRTPETVANMEMGGYVLKDVENPAIVLLASGSEVDLAVAGADLLAEEGIKARVVSMPCLETFVAQEDEYLTEVLPAGVPRLAVEAGSPEPWHKLTPNVLGMTTFGASAPGPVLFKHFGFSPETLAFLAKDIIA